MPYIENINQKGEYEETALHKLLKQRVSNPLLVKQLLAWGADPNLQDTNQNNALHLLLKQKNPNPQTLDYLLPYIKNINQKGEYDRTALEILLSQSDPNPTLMRKLLSYKANGRTGNIPEMALIRYFESVKRPNPEIVQALIQNGIDLNQKDQLKKPALFHILKKERPDSQTIRMLLDNGVPLNERYGNLFMRTPLHWVMEAKEPDPDLVRLFLEKGADAHMKDGCGKTALQHYQEKFPGHAPSGVQLLASHLERVRQHTPSLKIEEINDAQARVLRDTACATVRPASGVTLKSTAPQVLKQSGKSGIKTVWQSLMENLRNFWKQLIRFFTRL